MSPIQRRSARWWLRPALARSSAPRRPPISPAPARPSPIPIYSKWADAYKTADRHRPELPVDRLRRRHQADQGEDGHLRRLRHAAEARGPEGGRTGAVPDDHRRRGAGGERQGRAGRAAGARWRHRSPPSTWARSPSGTIARIKKLNPKLALPATSDRADLPLGRLGHQLPVLRLPVQVEPEVQGHRRRSDLGAVAGRASAPRATRALPT